MAEKEVRKTTTKRVVRKSSSTAAAPVRSSAKTAGVSVRKAPVRASVSVSQRRSFPKLFLAGLLMFIVLLGVSAAIGFSDKGQLDVAGTIAARKQNATPDEQEALSTVPVQQTQNNIPNGGLVGMGESETKAPVIEPVSTTTDAVASSTQTVASSTEETAVPPPSQESPTVQ